MRLEAWDESSPVSFDREYGAELTTLWFCEEAHNVLVMGPVGVCKTRLASALGGTSPAAGGAPWPSTGPTSCSST
jgi:hypothetical protein